MKVLITACTERAFAKGLIPLAHLIFDEVSAVNDNKLQLPVNASIYPHQPPRTAPRQSASRALQIAP
jgi:hypothetical protein